MSNQKNGAVDPGVGQKIDGNQIQDGGRTGHLGFELKKAKQNLCLK
jgi:hypothetical protein